ncbi:MAG TPA: zinc metalloprotease [Polyangia bacterium]|nr:zinc metalloprotease [Polyangia bacterium]
MPDDQNDGGATDGGATDGGTGNTDGGNNDGGNADGGGGETPPTVRTCGTMESYQLLVAADPQYADRLAALETTTTDYIALHAQDGDGSVMAARSGPIRIPVVVHVVYNDAASNISDAQVQSQIPVLNADYHKRNTDLKNCPKVWEGVVGDVNIEFYLATTDPTGAATNGITRTSTTVASFTDDNKVKSAATGGHDPWPTDTYLNIWVCKLASLLGYAQFPAGPAATDGVVILHTAFGTTGTAAAPFNLGRTATHEVGHWLNLRHIWGDVTDCSGTDFVSDTPNAGGPNYGKPTFPHVTCTNGPNGDMFVNFMDYVDDDTMVMFSKEQALRMQATLSGARSKLGGGP